MELLSALRWRSGVSCPARPAQRAAGGDGTFEIALEGLQSCRQSYLPNSAIVRTVLEGQSGSIEIIDFAPRFKWRERSFRPQTLVRRVRPLSGSPRITVKIAPNYDYGRREATVTSGSNSIRFSGPQQTLRLTTDAPIDYIVAETPFMLDTPINLIFGPDETLTDGVAETAPTSRSARSTTGANGCTGSHCRSNGRMP